MNVTNSECEKCGQAVRVVFDDYAEVDDDRELSYDVSTGEVHNCWTQLPDNAELIRLD